MTKATILEGNIKDKLYFELMLVITFIKNNNPKKILANNFNFYKAHFYKKLDLSHL